MRHDLTHAWHNLRLPPRHSSQVDATNLKSDLFHESHTLGPLLPDSTYEAKVSAKNTHGWSESSSIFHFYTQGKGKSDERVEKVFFLYKI